ncbi:MAG: hypothetical protein NVSMB13_16630 [Mycobacteriales bacterium]
MGVLIGVVFGLGVLVALSAGRPPRARSGPDWRERRTELLLQAGIEGVGPGQLLALQAVLGLLAFVVVLAISKAVPVAVAFGLFGGWAPLAIVKRYRRTRSLELRDVWPELVDNLASGVRAGLSLPEALTVLGTRGPEPLRTSFLRFADDYRATGRFNDCLDRLKAQLADPIGDRVCESLRMAREVGGTDLGRLLRTLSTFLREDARTRAELETRQGWTVNAAPARDRCSLVRAAPAGQPVLDDHRLQQRERCPGPGCRWWRVRGGLPDHDADRAAARGAAGAPVSALAMGLLLGMVAATGLLLIVLNAPMLRRARLDDRLAPYLRDAPRPSRLLSLPPTVTPFATLERLLRPVLGDAARMLERYFGGSASIRRRLAQLGRGDTVEQFRTEQVIWGALGLLAGVAVQVVALATRSGPNPLALVVLCAIAAVGGVLGRDYWLSAQVRRREESMLAEFPTVAELLALAVAAGEGPVGALERVCRLSSGELPRELGLALAEARSGATLVQALEGICQRTSLDALARFVDGVSVAIERGTPLAEVLRAQAVDVREAGKRALLESGGKREIAIVVPVNIWLRYLASAR